MEDSFRFRYTRDTENKRNEMLFEFERKSQNAQQQFDDQLTLAQNNCAQEIQKAKDE